MCVITDTNDIVVSVSLIPGVGDIPIGFHVYFPVKDCPAEGTFYKPS
jgi:hypothetical protein